jgi:hypothetical protein
MMWINRRASGRARLALACRRLSLRNRQAVFTPLDQHSEMAAYSSQIFDAFFRSSPTRNAAVTYADSFGTRPRQVERANRQVLDSL